MKLLAHLRANAIAYAALFVALGGTTYAAARIDGRDVVNDSLTGQDIRESTLKGATELASGKVSAPVALNTGGSVTVDVPITLPRHSLLTATASFLLAGDGGDDDRPRCQLQIEPPGGGASPVISSPARQTIPATTGNEATMALTGGHKTTKPGEYHVVAVCDVATGGTATVMNGSLSAVAARRAG